MFGSCSRATVTVWCMLSSRAIDHMLSARVVDGLIHADFTQVLTVLHALLP